MRKPFQGTWNIIRFNWHFYLIAFGLLVCIVLLPLQLSDTVRIYSRIIAFLIFGTTIFSLLVSFYIYDLSALYKLHWLNGFEVEQSDRIVNIHAGFDETSVLLKAKFGPSELIVLDFYDSAKHTEVSLKRARKAYPAYPETIPVETRALPLADTSVDAIFLIFSAHEIRNRKERIDFFTELRRILKPSGQILVTEHLRDGPNFLAYNIGFFHFYAKATWLETFTAAKIKVQQEVKVTPFVSTFVLKRNGATS